MSPGVGKTAIVEGLAEGKVPIFLANKRIVVLDLSLIVAGTKYRGQFEERLKGILKELKESRGLIVFIDALADRRRLGRGVARRRQHLETRALPRGDLLHRRHHP